jgi:hypothetical protein
MIDSLNSLGRNPLPAITTLNLRSNRLNSLAGVERLLSLERVDFRDNKLTDPTELARLTCIPELAEIYVYRNPFCKTHPTHRITIFNLFRKTPGYTEDVIIDSTGPTAGEKRQLVDRAPEMPGRPVVQPPPEDDSPSAPPVPPKVVRALDTPSEDADALRRTGSLQRTKSSRSAQGSQKKKKGPKRRIVELSQNETVPRTSSSGLASLPYEDMPTGQAPRVMKPEVEPVAKDSFRSEEPSKGQKSGDPSKMTAPDDRAVTDVTHTIHQQLPPIDTTTASKSPEPQQEEFDAGNDLYKKKIEALRQDFGNTWLSALGDDSWDTTSVTSFPSDRGYSSPTIRPTLPRTPSQGIVSGGRTLGWNSHSIYLLCDTQKICLVVSYAFVIRWGIAYSCSGFIPSLVADSFYAWRWVGFDTWASLLRSLYCRILPSLMAFSFSRRHIFIFSKKVVALAFSRSALFLYHIHISAFLGVHYQ